MFSRRTFVRTVVAGAVTLALCPAFAAQKTLSADIVVVGAGSAGLTAAVQAAQKGAKVIVLEKNPFIGGNSQHAEGVFAVGSEWQRLRSDVLTKQQAFEGLMERHLHKLDANLVRDYVYGSAENVSWLASLGLTIECIRMTPWEEPTWHTFLDYKGVNHGAALIKCLKDNADKLGVKTLVSTPAKSLVTKDGVVVGVKARNDDSEDDYTINAKAVILASGGFADAKHLKELAHRDPEGWKHSVPIGKTGDGLEMAYKVGAQKGRVSFVGHLGTEGKGISFPSQLYTTSWQPSTLWVNSDGVRFDNEAVAFSFSQAANAIYSQFGHYGWSIYDESQVKYMMERGVDSGVGVLVPVGAKLTNLKKEIQIALDAKSDGFKAATSVADLAKQIGVPAKQLEKEIVEYNKWCEQGHDNRFFKDERYLRKIDTKKLYAIKLKSYFFSSYGGLVINRGFQVLDLKNKPIKGLYAAGLEVSNMVGDTYTTWSSGHAFGYACYTGRHSGLLAAEFVKAAK